MSGIVYVLSHKAMPDLLKIGFTTRSIEERVQELSSTGVPGKYTVELYFRTDDASQFELLLHRTLREFHFEKEFFKADIETVIKAIHALISENRFQLYKFQGKSSHLATTKEQVAEEKKLRAEERKARDERHRRMEAMAKEFSDKYLHKTYEELRAEYTWGVRHSERSEFESKQLLKMMRLKREEESRLREIERQKSLIIFEDKFADALTKLGLKVHDLLNRTAKPKFLLAVRGYSFDDGKTLARTLKQDEIELIANFANVFQAVSNLFSAAFAFHHIGISEDQKSLIIRHNKDELSEYFKGILLTLKNN